MPYSIAVDDTAVFFTDLHDSQNCVVRLELDGSNPTSIAAGMQPK